MAQTTSQMDVKPRRRMRKLLRRLVDETGIRTGDLLVANEALSQLSYSPTSSKSILANALVLANTRSPPCRQKSGARPGERHSKSSQTLL